MIDAIKYQLSHLTDFSGRDARSTFWYYILFLVILQFLIGIVAAIPLYIDMFSGAMDAAQAGTDPADVQASMMAGMGGGLERQAMIGAVISVVMIGLFLAAFVRRLHDAGFSGWWALIPVATQLGAIWASFEVLGIMTEAFETMAGDPDAITALQGETAAYSLIGWAGYVVVIIFGLLKSKGPNQYGEEPVSF